MTKLRITLALLMSMSLLQACVPLVAGGAFAGTMVATDRRTTGTIMEDEGIELKTVREINLKYRDETHVNVHAYNRSVLLTGEAATEAIKADVEKIARGIANVRNVTNAIAVAGNSSLASRSSDTLLTTKVKARFLSEDKFNPNHVKVVTEAGVVYLLGQVTPQEGDAAAQITATTSGVLKVVKGFEYVDHVQEPAKADSAAKKDKTG